MELCEGKIVRSRCGRDAGRWCVVLSLSGPYAMIADGDLRRLSAPKRKKCRHLAPTACVLSKEQYATDRSLKQALLEYATHGSAGKQGGQELVEGRCH